MFDFTNYTYSALVTFIAMVIGMAYPSLLQAIQRIDETYHDDLMIRRFKEESTYKHFNEVLILAVGGGFYLAFPALYAGSNEYDHSLVCPPMCSSSGDIHLNCAVYTTLRTNHNLL